VSDGIAVVGMGCRYPDADSPESLWESVLARRRAFRRIPAARMSIDDYFASDRAAPDRTYSAQAAVLRDWSFDRRRFRIGVHTYATADTAHWLALETADAALADAGMLDDVERDRIAVIIGNTLTGDRTRANAMRGRWPFVARVIDAALAEEGLDAERRRTLLGRIESRYKSPFAEVEENTLAGALSNTIAGRICNYFGFGGGGYTVDGACASSLLAIADACALLEANDVDVVVAGGVDLSLDPFELIGFAKTAALAAEEMFVYDRRANGFLPGEGCGMVVLMRHAEARAASRRIYATIRGWGISSDGHGGLTRPEIEGQTKALRRAYARAGFGIDTVTFFEGHGTGTPVGDAVEVEALLGELRAHAAAPGASFIGSVKANIGHTKAAAGVAGFIKAAMAVRHGVVPPSTACEEPLDALTDVTSPLRIRSQSLPWPAARPRRAAVSAMGFGGINTHVVLQAETMPRRELTTHESILDASAQDAELFLFAAATPGDLATRIAAVASRAEELSLAELGDLAVTLGRQASFGDYRAALVASTPRELAAAARTLAATSTFAEIKHPPRIAFLFSGQGSPVVRDGGVWQRRFPTFRFSDLWNDARFDDAAARGGTALAQPSIVAASLCALRLLDVVGIRAGAAVGHSLGEITSLCWAGAFDEAAALDIAFARGAAMQPLAGGRMAALACGTDVASRWLNGDVTVAGINSPRQCVVSGSAEAVATVVAAARRDGVEATILPVDTAFHTSTMAAAGPALSEALRQRERSPLARRVVSTVTGAPLPADVDLTELAVAQLTHPVLFYEGLRQIAGDADLLIEVGPGTVLTGIAATAVATPVVSVDACGKSLAGLLGALGAAFVAGVDLNGDVVFGSRFVRPFDLSIAPSFIESPCEAVPRLATPRVAAIVERAVVPVTVATDPERLLREVIAARADLPIELVTPESGLLRDLHLNSITVAHLLGEVAQRLALPPLTAPTHFANATVAEAARALAELRDTGAAVAPSREFPAGVAEWVRTFTIERVAQPLPSRTRSPSRTPAVVSLIGCDAMTSFARLRQAAGQLRAGDTLVVMQERSRGSAFARTLYLERPDTNVCVINAETLDEALVAGEAANVDGFAEVFYEHGQRFVPRLMPVSFGPSEPLHANDVLLVSGGGKGIAAESALHLARRSGAAVGIVGRSDPDADAELAANLARFRRDGIRVHYVRADATGAAAIARAVPELRAALGAITVVIHGAGTNEPALIEQLDEEQFRAVFAPKVEGLGNLLRACDGDSLRLVVAFGSVIARSGMRGEAHYAFANEWLAAAMDDFAAAHPRCRALTIEWSVWSGAGMGERLGRIEALRREGITPIGLDDAVSVLESLVASDARGSVVVAGRLGASTTLSPRAPDLPILRFLEQPRVAIDGIEIVADTELTLGSDSYLGEHVFRGDALLPAAVALEAMAQAASALRPLTLPLAFVDLDFRWPIVAGERATTMRIAALAREDSVDVVLRSSATQFTVDHFRAHIAAGIGVEPQRLTIPATLLPLDVEHDVYDALLFHRGRFRRIRSYRVLTARECVAEIEARREPWFAVYRPSALLLGDPGVRDAAIHALQACVPHATVLPSAVESIELLAPLPEHGSVFVHAHERERAADHFVYELALTDAAGFVVERWHGLRLQIVERRAAAPDFAPILWAPLLERRLDEIAGVPVRVTVNCDSPGPRTSMLHVVRRPDGKRDDQSTSVSHAAGLTVTVSSPTGIACDLEPVVDRGEADWATLLGPALLPLARTVAAQTGEDFAASATRIWTAHECTQKRHGLAAGALTLSNSDAGGVVTLSSGADRITTFVLGNAAGQRFACGFAIGLAPQTIDMPWKKRRTS
jgi:enediyne polyketide synthase